MGFTGVLVRWNRAVADLAEASWYAIAPHVLLALDLHLNLLQCATGAREQFEPCAEQAPPTQSVFTTVRYACQRLPMSRRFRRSRRRTLYPLTVSSSIPGASRHTEKRAHLFVNSHCSSVSRQELAFTSGAV